MRNIFIILFLVTINIVSFSQNQNETKAVLFDSEGLPFRLETKSITDNGNTLKYIKHSNWGSSCVIQTRTNLSDTLIIKEESYIIKFPSTVYESYNSSELKIYSSTQNEDTVWVSWGNDIYEKDSIYFKEVGDTILTNNSYEEFEAFAKKYKEQRVSLILNQEISIKKGSLFLIETNLTFYKNDKLIKYERFNRDKTYRTTGEVEYSNKCIKIRKSEFKNDSLLSVSISDSIFWNKDSKHIFWKINRSFIDSTITNEYKIGNTYLDILNNDTIVKRIHYSKNEDYIRNLLLSETIYFDIPVGPFFLRYLDRLIVDNIENQNGIILKWNYSFDNNGNITEAVETDNLDKLIKTIKINKNATHNTVYSK